MQNPYIRSGDAASSIGQEGLSKIIFTESMQNLQSDVRYAISSGQSLRLLFIGEFGAGKTTRMNIVQREIESSGGLCINIEFARLRSLIERSTDPQEQLDNVIGVILDKIAETLGIDFNVVYGDRTLMSYYRTIMDMFAKARKELILLTFDEIETLFNSFELEVIDFASFLQGLADNFISKQGWNICACLIDDYLSELYTVAQQLYEGRFQFHIIEPLRDDEISRYIIEKNSSKTGKHNDPYPYDLETIKFVGEASGGIPRYIEAICYSLWASGESRGFVTLNDAVETFSRVYRHNAQVFFPKICQTYNFSDNVKAFFHLLFVSGGKSKTFKELAKYSNYCIVRSFQSLDEDSVIRRLRNAVEELLDASDPAAQDFISKNIEFFGIHPKRFSFKDPTYRSIYESIV
ncbi:hypothetical protein NDA02_05385 [Leptolyngbya sp. ST-U4]